MTEDDDRAAGLLSAGRWEREGRLYFRRWLLTIALASLVGGLSLRVLDASPKTFFALALVLGLLGIIPIIKEMLRD